MIDSTGKRTLIEQVFANAPFVQALGIELTTFGEGWCHFQSQA